MSLKEASRLLDADKKYQSGASIATATIGLKLKDMNKLRICCVYSRLYISCQSALYIVS